MSKNTCPICGKPLDDGEAGFLDNGSPAHLKCIEEENLEENKNQEKGCLNWMDIVFKLTGNTADLEVYEDHLVYIGKTTAQAVIMGLAYNGTKEYYFCDLTSVKYKAPSFTLNGYLSFEYPGSQHIQETIWFGKKKPIVAEFEKAYEYIKDRIAFYKKQKSSTTVQQLSPAEELKKFKDLLDLGIISQEEFEAKKKQLLGL